MDKKINKKGQITIFIILAILIVIAIVVLFFFLGRNYTQSRETQDTQSYIDKCIRDYLQVSAQKILEGGGKIEPQSYLMYKSEKYNYLCYQQNYYLTCVNQFPMLKSVVEDEIKKDIDFQVRKCFDNLKQDLQDNGFDVSDSSLDFSVELVPGRILVEVDKKIDINKAESSESFSKFDSQILSPLYGLVMIAREIVNQESQYCNFEYNGYMLLHPEYNIKRIDYDDSKVYLLTDTKTGKLFKFAVRSCAFPPGF